MLIVSDVCDCSLCAAIPFGRVEAFMSVMSLFDVKNRPKDRCLRSHSDFSIICCALPKIPILIVLSLDIQVTPF